MEAKANYTLVGIVLSLLALAFITMAIWLSVGFDRKNYQLYGMIFYESVAGLNEGAPLRFNGVQVGYVSKILLNTENPQEVKVLAYIEEKAPITTSTFARLVSQIVTGNTYISLAANSSNCQALCEKGQAVCPLIPTQPSLFHQFDNVFKEMADNINQIARRAKKLLNDENLENFKSSMKHMENITEALSKNSKALDNILKNSDILMKNSADASRSFPRLAKHLDLSLEDFRKMAHTVNQAGSKVEEAMGSGKFAMDKISQQTLPSTQLLLQRLQDVAVNLEQITQQIQANPSVIVRGSAPAIPGPGE